MLPAQTRMRERGERLSCTWRMGNSPYAGLAAHKCFNSTGCEITPGACQDAIWRGTGLKSTRICLSLGGGSVTDSARPCQRLRTFRRSLSARGHNTAIAAATSGQGFSELVSVKEDDV